MELIDEREDKSDVFEHKGGVSAFVQYLNRSRTAIHPNIFYFQHQEGPIAVEVGGAVERLLPGVDVLLHQQHPAEGRRHAPRGFPGALTRKINEFIEKEGLAKRENVQLTGDDAREG
jgi:DNA gyrase subunit B